MEEQPSASRGIKRSIPEQLRGEIDVIAAKVSRLTANLADLDDNKKRWLIVGICLHSIISPALRKFVVSILTILYNELIRYQKIDTQTYSTHLKQYPPTNADLNYEAVNNNRATYGYQKAKYDYTIKSVVDFSKLFLQTHMAQYTGFDDTCDSSAVLGLIINIDKFPVAVKSDAENVRRIIRNPWAHCDFTKWDAVKYADSFQLMEKLIKDLSLSSNEEIQIIGEMKKWEINGQQFLSGTTLGLELVNDIRQQTQVLAEYTKLVANETDQNSLRLNHVLENFDIILVELTELKNDMETKLMDINKKLLDRNLSDSKKNEIEFWKEQDVNFVNTPMVNVISKILESDQIVLIVGEPGIGKTMLLHHVTLKLQKKIEYTITPCTGVQDIDKLYEDDKRQMFVLDDICGRFTVSLSEIEHWDKTKDTIKRILKKGKTKIAATCRLDIYNDELFKVPCSIFNCNTCNLSVEYSREDKLTICRQYLSETNIQLLKDRKVDFTPLMCYLYSRNQSFNLTDFIECPFKTYQEEWEQLKDLHPYKYCSLFFCVIYNGTMKESLFDVYNQNNTKNKSVFKNIFEICEISRGTSRSKIKTVLDSMIGTYVTKIRNEYRVIHDQMFDFMCGYFGSKDAMVRCILRYSSIRVFNQRTQLKSVNEPYGKFTIMISENYEKEYFERIKSDVQLGKLNQCFYNTQVKYKKYRTSFLKVLKSIDDEVLIPQIYQSPKNQPFYRHYRHADESFEAMECKDCPDSDEDSDNYEDYTFVQEGPLIKSCLRGYYDICQYFISKNVDLKKCDSDLTPLIAACMGGNERTVQLFIDKRSDVNMVDKYGQTPLSAACKKGNVKIVMLLIDKGSDVNKVCSGDRTPLTAACNRGHENIVQLLIDNGSDVNLFDGIKLTPLTTACYEENENIVQLLIDKGSDVNNVDGCKQTPLTAACSGGNEKIVQLLIDKGSDVNMVGRDHQTPLTAACEGGNERIAQLLIDSGSYVNQVGKYNKTPLMAACEKGNEKIVQLLLNKGSDVNLVDSIEQTTLTAACLKGNENIVQLIIDNGSDVNMVGRYNQIPLTAACEGGNEKIVKLLIDKGSDVNKVWRNRTPLTTACIAGNENMIQLLIDRGSDAKLMDGRGHTPLAISCRQNNEKLVRFFIDKGSDVNTVDVFDQTPLTIACEGGNEKIVQLLIANGSDTNQVNDKENTALTMACKYRNEKIVQVLIDNRSQVNQVDGLGMTPLTVACSGRFENKRMFEEQREKYYGKQVDDMIHAHIMHMASSCSGGDEKIVQLLIDKGSNVNQADGMGVTPLSAACKGENEKIVQILIDNGSDVNQVDKTKRTPLAIACLGKHEKIVQLLIDKGCDVNQVEKTGETPLTIACSRGNHNIVQLLIDNGSEVEQVAVMGKTPLVIACETRDEKIVQLLLDEGSDINQVGGKWTPLTAACKRGNEKIVQLLIDKGCDVNLVDDMKQTPLTSACSGGNKKIVQLLLEKGCDVNQVDGKGQTPLMAACNGTVFSFIDEKEREKIVQLLLDKGSNLYQADTYGRTPLTISCYRGNEKIVQVLLDRGSEVNQVDDMKQTPLTAACSGENKKIVQLLIGKGCDVNQFDGTEQTPLTTACIGGNTKIVQLLIDKGSNINQVDGKGQTPLMAARYGKNETIIQLIIEKGNEFKEIASTCNRENEEILYLRLDHESEINHAGAL